ncbi:hypothetical protein BU23DRAFT_526526 [Bimuria novae-zelandiae CBS 107.79]|uniref:Uncharacterized protein n=1 Tax=Bimuria novae-zelandiae CBS 107.79 TaxID=1447943 RepID=A0A6A5VKU4_9PLEO|nr:hypothetical protein BU23DRAFT_526526 [Bimuria novae-zelandiae CBS 107.79]
MDLTPIKIRGKRKRPGTTKSNVQKAIEIASSRAKRAHLARKPTRAKKIEEIVMPTLPGLPQELLEMIFLYSMNISLPRASFTLGRNLSSKTVTLEFVLRSFFHTVDHKTNYRDRKTTSDSEIQSQLLACRFFTWDFFRSYVQKAHGTLIQQRGAIWKDASVQPPGLEAFDGLFPFKFTKITYLGFAEGFRIPEKLLRGPWTTDKAKLLYVLVSLNGELDWEGSMAGEIAKAGLRQAIEENNERAVAALAVLLGVAQMIDTSVLRKAVIECGCNINIVRQLLFNAQILHQSSPKASLDFHDPALWRWADTHEGKGVLLKNLLRKTDKFSLEFYLEGEEGARAKTVPFPYGGAKFDPRTAFDTDVGKEMLVRLYRTYGRKITASPRRRRHRNIEEEPHGEQQ